MDLVGIKVRLRPLKLQDLPQMALWNGDAELQFLVDCDLATDLGELECWYQKNVPDRNYQIYAIENFQGEVIGDLELDHICWRTRQAELRIRLGAKQYWGQGYGSEALRLILSFFLTQKRFERIYLKVYRFNRRAIRCYQKNGFKAVGILRRNQRDWKEIILMELTQSAYRKLPGDSLAG
ncbi:MAG: GNAT family protein [Bacillota bacterium]|jgi:RimJ/RimL family protein N-acetyltransferase